MKKTGEKKHILKREIEAGDIVRMVGILIFVGFAVWMTILLSQKFEAITASGGQSPGVGQPGTSLIGNFLENLLASAQSLKDYIIFNFPRTGLLILTFLQFVQVVITAIPSSITCFASGMIYGWPMGLLISSVGSFMGTALTFYLTRLLGRRVLTLFVSKKNIGKMENFVNGDTSTLVLLILFIIPSPKDFFPFFIGLTNMKAWKFFLISVIGRIPGAFIGCYLGATVDNRNWALLIGVTIFAVAVSAAFVIFNSKIMAFLKKKKPE